MEEILYLYVYCIKTKDGIGKYQFERRFPIRNTKVFVDAGNKTIVTCEEETYAYKSNKTMLTFEPLPLSV